MELLEKRTLNCHFPDCDNLCASIRNRKVCIEPSKMLVRDRISRFTVIAAVINLEDFGLFVIYDYFTKFLCDIIIWICDVVCTVKPRSLDWTYKLLFVIKVDLKEDMLGISSERIGD